MKMVWHRICKSVQFFHTRVYIFLLRRASLLFVYINALQSTMRGDWY